MKEIILCLAIFISTSIAHGADVNSLCGDEKDEKCVKLFQTFEFVLKQEIQGARRELQDSIDSFTKQMTDIKGQLDIAKTELKASKNELTATRNNLATQLREIQDNTIPIGFMYVQLPNQPDPRSLWVGMGWTEITSDYAGLFFRAAGGGSDIFGNIQEENSPRLTQLGQWNVTEVVSVVQVNPNNNWSARISMGAVGGATHWGLGVRVSTGEVRPRNTAMRIWRRSG